MLEQLYNIVKNGSSCGVQTFIHLSEIQAALPTLIYLQRSEKIVSVCRLVQMDGIRTMAQVGLSTQHQVKRQWLILVNCMAPNMQK